MRLRCQLGLLYLFHPNGFLYIYDSMTNVDPSSCLYPHHQHRTYCLLFCVMFFNFVWILVTSLNLVSAIPCPPLVPFPNIDANLPSTVSLIVKQLPSLDLGNGVARFTIPFAQPPVGELRFANPQSINGLNGYNISNLPPACYQGPGDPRGGNAPSEDCLYATYYLPKGAKKGDNLPTYVWVHGGSGIGGSSTGAGLDGSPFVLNQTVIVVLLQYRLGIFGWLQTGKTFNEGVGSGRAGGNTLSGNQAMRDVVMALKQVNAIVPTLGGDASKIVLMGQSSGASMVRALLTTPAANNLFSHAVMVSDPANYGLSSISDNNALGEYAMQKLGCDFSNITCARLAKAEDLLSVSLATYSSVPAEQPRISSGTPWRAMKGSYVTGSIETGAKSKVPIILTTVANEAGTIAAYEFEPSTPNAINLTYSYSDGETTSLGDGLCKVFNAGRGSMLPNLQAYPESEAQDGLRGKFETITTDGLWRCPTQFNAQKLIATGARVWLAQWNVGSTYPSNLNADYCNTQGRVCHEDDIYTIFGTAPSPTPAVKELSLQWQARLSSFARSNQPNAPNAISWPPIQSSTKLNLLSIGIAKDTTNPTSKILASQRPHTCVQTWGKSVEYDWQLYES